MGRRDAKAKEFWRDNGRFADFFNAVLFAGREVIRPEDLTELDTDVSAVVKGKRGYVNTVSRARDLVRKFGYGTEFVLLGLENQQKVNYAEPVCIMNYDAVGYWKECLMVSGERTDEKKRKNDWAALFSMEKGSRIHPIITIVLYYGSEPWDGPKTLHEMFVPTEKEILGAVPDYRLNLVEIRDSERLIFHNPDVEKVFSAIRKIYQKEIEAPELRGLGREAAEMVGTVVGSERIVNIGRRKGMETMELCKPLREMQEEAKLTGRVQGKILAYHEMSFTTEQIAEKMKLSAEEVNKVLAEDEK